MSNGQARFYPGVREDALELAHPWEPSNSVVPAPVVNIPFAVIDFLPSAVLDTLLLPVDLIAKGTD